MTAIDRRAFLRRGAAVGAGLSGAGTLQALFATSAAAAQAGRGQAGITAPGNGGYGPLAPAGPELALPAGFSYVAFGRTGEIMGDGRPTPPAHDGMAAFDDGSGLVRLVRNHELRGTGVAQAAPAYDALAPGGTTNLVFDTRRMQLVDSRISIAGTSTNCAGGPTPWGSWLTCEETTAQLGEPHGYVFDVPADATGPVDPVPLKAMGRFVHEAVAVDPATGVVYETEDRGSSGFYRFLPQQPGNLAAGGRLQMLAVRARPQYDTRTGQRVGKPLPVTWVDIEDPDPADAATNSVAVYQEGLSKGGATFDRLEGAWYADGRVYFNSTSGGDASQGQVWQYTPRGRSGGQLVLLFESPGEAVLDSPDNITVSPRTGGLVLCEDGGGEQYLRGVNDDGQIFDFAQNLLSDNEFAGATFTADGQVLFVNVQTPGTSFAITGPWQRGAL